MYGSYTLTGKVINLDRKLKNENGISKSIFKALGLIKSVVNGRYVFDKKKSALWSCTHDYGPG